MKEIPLIPIDSGLVALVDDDDFERVSKLRWKATRRPTDLSKPLRGYYAVNRVGRHPKALFMHRFIMDAPKGMEVDHINHNGLDNRRENLRICTSGENQHNRLKRDQNNTSSRFKGVYWDKTHRKWVAQIHPGGKGITLGYYNSEIGAAQAYDRAAIKYFGEYAKLNLPVTEGVF